MNDRKNTEPTASTDNKKTTAIEKEKFEHSVESSSAGKCILYQTSKQIVSIKKLSTKEPSINISENQVVPKVNKKIKESKDHDMKVVAPIINLNCKKK